jgi:hypothetical protein
MFNVPKKEHHELNIEDTRFTCGSRDYKFVPSLFSLRICRVGIRVFRNRDVDR